MVVLVGVLYFNSLGNQFTNWDDAMIYGNAQVRSLSWVNLARIFTPLRGETYQPVRMLSYAIDYYFWRLNPLGYHLTSLLFYILTCYCVYFCIRKLSANLQDDLSSDSHQRVALFGSLLFAAHPVHVEAVTWLAARKEVLQGCFLFLAFFLYLKVREGGARTKKTYLVLVLLSFLFAVLSKPSAIVFPGLILVYELARGRDGWINVIKGHKLFLLVSLGISALFTAILIKVMLDAGGVKPYRGGSFFNNLLLSFHTFIYNLKLLFFTVNYSAAYTIPFSNPIFNLRTFLFIGVVFCLLGFSLWSLKKTKIVFFSFFFFLVTVLPYLNIVPISTLLADRYVFIASFSYAFFLGALFERLFTYRYRHVSEGFFKVLTISLFLLLLLGYSSMTLRQNTVWENSYTLWSDAVEKYPDSNTANALMGVVYLELGMDDKAAGYLEKAVQILPQDYQSRNNLGIIYGRLNRFEKGIQEFMTAIWLRPDDDTTKINLSVLYERQKEYRKAEEILTYLIERNPENANLYFRKGLLYKKEGRFNDAMSEFNRSIELAPHMINPYEELGNIYLCQFRDREKAKYYYGKGVEIARKGSLKEDELRSLIQDVEALD
jgi:protein O-mannosyl-transferase